MMRQLLPFWLVFLAAFGGLPAFARASDGALPPATSQPQTTQEPVSGPVTGLVTGLQIPFAKQQTGPPPGPNLRFDRLSAADGLSFSLSTSILQDEQGFMWFGTRYGLDRYDGSSFTVYVRNRAAMSWAAITSSEPLSGSVR